VSLNYQTKRGISPRNSHATTQSTVGARSAVPSLLAPGSTA